MDGDRSRYCKVRSRPAPSRGFTTVELLVTCVIAATLVTLTVPSFRELALDARRTEQVNSLLRALHAARSAAIIRAEPTVICKSSNGRQCTPTAARWSEGWIVFANRDHDSPPTVDAGEPILMIQSRVDNIAVVSSRSAVTYWPFALAGTTATFVFCDERGSSHARAIIVSQTGRPRVSDRDASGKALRC